MPSQKSQQQKRVSGLDGLRGLAVAAVVFFHVYPGLVPGGFLGVDVFFVLSGYLITGIVVKRLAGFHGSIPWPVLRAFWAGRIRRLFPELAVVLFAVCVVASFAGPEFSAGLRAQVGAALVSCVNWILIAHGQNYFAAFAAAAGHPTAPALQHLWSLAVEEQFYVVWPLVLWGSFRLARRHGEQSEDDAGDANRHLAILVACAAVGSFVLMAAQAGTGSSDYYNTLTHCGGLLAGAALALWLPLDHVNEELAKREPTSPASPPLSAQTTNVDNGVLQVPATNPTNTTSASGVPNRTANILGKLALGGLAVLLIECFCLNGDTTEPELGGIVLASLATLPVVLAAATPSTDAARILNWRPAVFLGVRSYGIYLWHWPLIVLLGSPATASSLRGQALRGVVELCLPIFLASISRRYVTMPIRNLQLADVREWWSHVLGRTERPLGSRVVLALTAVALLPAALGLVGAPRVDPAQTDLEAQIAAGSAIAAATTSDSGNTKSGGAEGRNGMTPGAGPGRPLVTLPRLPELPPPGGPDPALGHQVTAIGDSVLLASASALVSRMPGIVIDAKVGRQIWQAPEELSALAGEGLLRHFVVVALGTNGAFQSVTLNQIKARIGRSRVLVLVTVHMPRTWQNTVNQHFAAFSASSSRTVLVNWNATVSPYPALLWPDATHPRPTGAEVYADLLAEDLSLVHE